MNIQNAHNEDIKSIFELYDMATEYQKTVYDRHWEGFELGLIQKEIEDKRLWKISVNETIFCVFSINYNDSLFWGEKGNQPSIYMHRIALHNEYRGQSVMKIIIDWAVKYCINNKKQYFRMDTWGENTKLIDYYKKCGFTHINTINLNNTKGFPKHYKGKLALLEMKINSSENSSK
jgi:ribosomal protein S18 acetylase RimI-like enzyme